MKTLAAVLVETGQPLELAELEIPALRPGQVLVEVAYSGVCHTQLLEARGYRGPDPYLPHCLGHEAAGRVLECGPDVTRCRPEDHVVISWMKGSGADVPGAVYRWGSRSVNAGGVTTFMRHAVVSENRLTPLPAGLDFAGALIGCAVATGAGAVRHTAVLRPGESVAVFGAGGVGLFAIAQAASLGARLVVAVDINPDRLRVAEQMGARSRLNPNEENVPEALAELTGRSLDVAIEATGRPEVMAAALGCVRPRGGRVVVIGNARGELLAIDPAQLNQGKRILGTWGGDNDPDRDFPWYGQQLRAGNLAVDPVLSAPYPLEEINAALRDLEQGRVARPLVRMTPISAQEASAETDPRGD